MDIFKVYVSTKKKTGEVTKSDCIITKSATKEDAATDAVKDAKNLYGFKGRVHVGGIYKRDENKKYQPV